MTPEATVFALNPAVDRGSAAATFAARGIVQIRDILTGDAADTLHAVLSQGTDWGLGWGASGQKGANVRGAALRGLAPADRARFGDQAALAARRGDFGFLYGQYPIVEAYLNKWDEGHPLDIFLEHLNTESTLDFVRHVSGIDALIKADGQATIFAPGHFLAHHDDHVENEGRRVAYVLNLAREWRPDWGGYLLFHDEDGDIVAGLRPRFNTLNLFRVPVRHSVSYVPPFAPVERFAISGWFRDR